MQKQILLAQPWKYIQNPNISYNSSATSWSSLPSALAWIIEISLLMCLLASTLLSCPIFFKFSSHYSSWSDLFSIYQIMFSKSYSSSAQHLEWKKKNTIYVALCDHSPLYPTLSLCSLCSNNSGLLAVLGKYRSHTKDQEYKDFRLFSSRLAQRC